MQLRINAGKRRDIDDRVPSEFLPHAGPDVQMDEAVRILRDTVRIAGVPQHAINGSIYTADRVQDRVEHANDNHGGDEVGHIRYGLDRFLQTGAVDHIKEQRKDNGERKSYQQRVDCNAKRVDNDALALVGMKKLSKLIKSNPFAVQKSEGRLVVLKGHHDTGHRYVTEN